jgi:GTP-binding protein EngB required for normal cell division
MEQVIDEFICLLLNTENYIRKLPQGRTNNEQLAEFLRIFREKRLEPLHWRLQRINTQRYVLSMVGLTNVGKSTLAEALLEHPVAPRRNGPATAIPVEYEYDCEPWRLQTIDERNLTVMEQKFDSAQALSKVLEKKVFTPQPEDLSNGSNAKLIVKGPMRLLEGGLVFADTPGFGAAQTADCSGTHENVLVEYLQKHVHEVMFCLSASNAMVSPAEKKFFESIGHLCSTVVVTKWDAEDEQDDHDKKQYEGKFSELFPMCRFLFVNAKRAIENPNQQDSEACVNSHAQDLQALFQTRRGKQERQKLLVTDVERACNNLVVLLRKPLQDANLPNVPWHKAALTNFQQEAVRQNLKIPSFT